MKTSINLPDSLVSEIQLWNKEHPDKQIGISGTCRKALEDALSRAKGGQHTEVNFPALKSEA
jgi:hypothetical protein